MTKLPFFLIFTHFFFFLLLVVSADFSSGVDLTWGGERAKVSENGRLLQLSLDKVSGAGFQSKQEYLFGKIDMQIKVVPGNSAGTVTAYYVGPPTRCYPNISEYFVLFKFSYVLYMFDDLQLSSQGPMHDEIDFEFLGNASGEPYMLYTNVYTQGKGNREQQFYLWFDPRQAFHTHSILWNYQQILLVPFSLFTISSLSLLTYAGILTRRTEREFLQISE
ncbi:hypothetical protein HHK36_023211 [Tetracentron sinense]|uniref:GH16 domain-containing protein n=1 Tax=Tetracentron sinense TaxID=13715 RepID=A0A834YM58_TETSI|nr:hypothetical protein HHK36_023211 [Tetracentron sinense]